MRTWLASLIGVCALVTGLVSPATAQVRAELYAQGFTSPVAFVQDPSNRSVQYVVEKQGHIRIVINGAVQDADFLDISDQIATNGELGLLGLAFSPNYAVDGRFWVFFSNPEAHSVIARFVRSADDPLRADPASRFDLLWPDGNRFIAQPSPNHKGGNLAFGPDGYLYTGLGDGGEQNDELHLAQNPTTLHGKMLRLDVNVPDDDAEGYDLPADNPFMGQDGVLPHIWAFGLRNPWRWSFDDPAHGGTGALVIADVGQDAWEEIDYVPMNAAGRNYGWRLFEGTHEFNQTEPGFAGPLTDPIFEYSHEVGKSIIGGFVYRGTALGATMVGRYFFADFIRSRLWSAGLAIDENGQATVVDVIEHTAEIALPGLMPSSFGVDADGEIYVVSVAKGRVYRLVPSDAPPVDGPPNPAMQLESPVSGVSPGTFVVTGWAIDRGSALGPGIDAVHVWAVPTNGSPATFLGWSGGITRPDIAALYGARFLQAGFSVPVANLPAGQYAIVAYAHSTVSNNFEAQQAAIITVGSRPLLYIDVPAPYATYAGRFPMSGWALDLDATSGTGVSEVQIWAQRPGEGARLLGNATLGISRPDLGAAFGAQFTNSGWSFVGGELPPDTWTITAHLKSAATGAFIATQTVVVVLTDGLRLWVDSPTPGQVLAPGQVNHIAGWVLDTASLTTTGVSALHMWAVPSNGNPAVFLGLATMGLSRPDVGAAFGSQFAFAGYDCAFNLPPGEYDIIVYPVRSSTNWFDNAQVIHIIVGSQ